jgi:hypothetical protein
VINFGVHALCRPASSALVRLWRLESLALSDGEVLGAGYAS